MLVGRGVKKLAHCYTYAYIIVMKPKNTYVIQAWSMEDGCWLDCEEATYPVTPKNLEKVREKFENWVGAIKDIDLRVISRTENVVLNKDDVFFSSEDI